MRSVSQKAFQWRLRLLPYHYTAFYDAHTYGCPVMRPTFFSFPVDSSAYALDQQWMLGDALLVICTGWPSPYNRGQIGLLACTICA